MEQLKTFSFFSWTRQAGGLLFGATIPMLDGEPMCVNPEGQVERVFTQTRELLLSSNVSPSNLLQMRIILTNIDLRSFVNQEWEHWPNHAAASRSVVEVSKLSLEGLAVELEFVVGVTQ